MKRNNTSDLSFYLSIYVIDNKPCLTTSWSDWTECNPKCGRGFRYKNREFLNRTQAMKAGCKDKLYIREMCENYCVENGNDSCLSSLNCRGYIFVVFFFCYYLDEIHVIQNNDPNCTLSEWGPWTECSTKCGNGEQLKTRQYVLPRAKKRCEVSSFRMHYIPLFNYLFVRFDSRVAIIIHYCNYVDHVITVLVWVN